MASLNFKTVSVKERTSIKKFVEESGLVFEKGCGYYQLTKPEVIQDYKKVVARRKLDGSFVSGPTVREVLGIQSTSKKYSLDLTEVPDFDVFVQSTSVNRVLVSGTEFLYEVSGNLASPLREKGGRKRKTGADAEGSTPAKKICKESESVGGHEYPVDSGVGIKTGGTGGPVEIVFSFDTTGSMYPCLTQVRRKVAETVKRLQQEISGIRIAVIAHGDYCDRNSTYVTKIMDFTTDSKKLCNFVEKVEATGKWRNSRYNVKQGGHTGQGGYTQHQAKEHKAGGCMHAAPEGIKSRVPGACNAARQGKKCMQDQRAYKAGWVHAMNIMQ